MDRRSLITLGVAVVIGIFAVYLANAWFSGKELQQEQVAEAQGLTEVAVASQDLPFGAPITTDTIQMVSWPASSVPDGAIRDLATINAQRNVAIRPIARGEPVLASRMSNRAILSANIPENMRAMTVPVNATTGVAGFIFPGDVVDVFLTRQIPGEGASRDDQMTTVILENVQVLAVDTRASENETDPEVSNTATLLVDQFGGQKLALANEIGVISLTLRNVEDQMIGTTRTVSARDLGGAGLYIADRGRGSGAARAPAPSRVAAPSRSAQPAQSAPAAAPRSSGSSMLIYRGTDVTRQEVQTNGR